MRKSDKDPAEASFFFRVGAPVFEEPHRAAAKEISMYRNPPERRHQEEPDREPARPIEEPASGGSAARDDPPPLEL